MPDLAFILSLAATAVIVLRVVSSAEGRASWALLATGAGAVTVAEGVALRRGGLPIGATAGAIGLLAYPAWYGAFVLRARRMIGDAPRSLWLDGLLLWLAASAFVCAFLLPDLQARTTAGLASLLQVVAHPAGDLALLGFLAGTVVMVGRPDRQSLLLVAGLGAVALVHLLWVFGPEADGYPARDATLGVLAAGGVVLLACAALTSTPSGRMLPVGGWWELTSPVCISILACVILTADHFTTMPHAAIVLAAAAFIAALLRLTWTLREVRSLALHRREARTDDLTGLPNRRALFRELEVLTAGGASSSRRFALLQLDLDGLKELNDTLGHAAGDELLMQVARRLSDVLPKRPARVGGDEFAAIVAAPADAEEVAERARAILDEPLDVDGVAVAVNASIGIARFPADAADARELARRADVAMYDAKRSGMGVARYFPERDEHSPERLSLAADLRRAIERDELWLAFQPQVDIATGRISGAEALIRWRHPVRGDVPPGVLVPVAERSGLMPRLTAWVLEHAVAQAATWRRQGLDLRVAVNVSAIVLVDASLPDRIGEVLRASHLTPDNLVVEVTEDAVMSDPRRAIAVLERIERLRVGIAIDDFGTGHSSLEQLKRLPADELKL